MPIAILFLLAAMSIGSCERGVSSSNAKRYITQIQDSWTYHKQCSYLQDALDESEVTARRTLKELGKMDLLKQCEGMEL